MHCVRNPTFDSRAGVYTACLQRRIIHMVFLFVLRFVAVTEYFKRATGYAALRSTSSVPLGNSIWDEIGVCGV